MMEKVRNGVDGCEDFDRVGSGQSRLKEGTG